MHNEVLEQWQSYIDICMALNQLPTLRGFGQHLIDSYEDDV